MATVTTYPLQRFLVDFAPAYGDSWRTEITKLIDDPFEYEIVVALGDALAVVGGFVDPVVIDPISSRVRNGMHRTAAAVLSGATHLTIADDYPDDDTELVEVTLTLPRPKDYDAAADELFSILRSFPFSHHWVTTDSLSSTTSDEVSTFTAAYYCHAAHVDDLVLALLARTARYGYDVAVTDVAILPDE